MSPTTVSAAARSSFASCPWETMTPPIFFMSLFLHIAMVDRNVIAATFQDLSKFVRHHNRTVLPSRAADADRKIRLALFLIERQQILQQTLKPFDRLVYLGI